jgi:formate/nitrite transporter FocA (FNT family)
MGVWAQSPSGWSRLLAEIGPCHNRRCGVVYWELSHSYGVGGSKAFYRPPASEWGCGVFGNFVGAAGAAALVHGSGTLGLGEGAVRASAVGLAQGKVSLPFMEAFVRGIFCNMRLCRTVWLSYSALHVAGKYLMIILPVAAFVALGFEHSIAIMYFIPVAMLAKVEDVPMGNFVANPVPFTPENIVGGACSLRPCFGQSISCPRAKRGLAR